MPGVKEQLRSGFIEGLKTGWSGFVWMCKIVIPLSFVITVLQWTGWLDYLDFLLNPLTNLIMEGIVQHRSGINAAKITVIRIVAAIIAVLVVSQFMGDTSQSVVLPASLTVRVPFSQLMGEWAAGTLGLIAKIFGIIMSLMVILGWLRALGWVNSLLRALKPLMRILGLPEGAAMMFMAGVLFGVFYGSAVLVEETRSQSFRKDELERLHISIGICHAIVEDPSLFVILGLNAFWMWIPKIVMSIIAVQAYRLYILLRDRLFRGSTGNSP